MDVAVLDPLPLFRHGVLAALGGGAALGSTADLRRWIAATESGVLLLTLHDEESWTNLVESCRRSEVRTVAVLSSFSVIGAANALRAGAAHVMEREADSRRLSDVLDEVGENTISLPLTILRATIAARADPHHPPPSDDELRWLRALATGATVPSVARDAGYSERALYRRLRQLYQGLGVQSRTQALILARDQGWL